MDAHNNAQRHSPFEAAGAAAAAGATSPFAGASLSIGHFQRSSSDTQMLSPGLQYGFHMAGGAGPAPLAQSLLQPPPTLTPFSPGVGVGIGRANSGSHATMMQPSSLAYGGGSQLNWPSSHLLTPTDPHARRSSSGGNQSTLHMLASPIPSLPFGYFQQPYATTASSPGGKREVEAHPSQARSQPPQSHTPPAAAATSPFVPLPREASSSRLSTATTVASSSSHANSSAEPSFDGRASSGESGGNGSSTGSSGNPRSPQATRVSSRHKRPKHTPLVSASASTPSHTRTLDRSALIRQDSEQSGSSSVSASPLLAASFSRLSHRAHPRIGSPALTTEDNSNCSSPRIMHSPHLSSVASPSPRAAGRPASSARSTAITSRKASFSSTVSAEDLSPSELDALIAAGLPLPIPVDGVVTGQGNGSAAGVTIPKPVPGKRGGGFSCHCCKTSKKNIDELFLCTNHLPKNPESAVSVEAARAANGGAAAEHRGSGQAEAEGDTSSSSGSKRCHKKYCIACLKRLYPKELMGLRGQHADQWTCPSCLNRCSCAGCERKVGGAAPTATLSPAASAKLKSKTGGQSSRAVVSTAVKSSRQLTDSPRLSGKRNRSKLKLHEDEAAAADDAASRQGSDIDDDADWKGSDPIEDDCVEEVTTDAVTAEPSMLELASMPHEIETSLFASAYPQSLLSPSSGPQMTAAGRIFQLPATPPTQGIEFAQYPSAPAAAAASGRPSSSPSHSRHFVGSTSPPIASYASPHSSAAPLAHHRASSSSGSSFADESHAAPFPSDMQRRLIAQQQGIHAMQLQLAKLKEEERRLQQPQQQQQQQQRMTLSAQLTPAPPPQPPPSYAPSSMDLSVPSSGPHVDPLAPTVDLELLLLDKHRRLLQQQQMTSTLLRQIQSQKEQHRHMHMQRQQQTQWEQSQGASILSPSALLSPPVDSMSPLLPHSHHSQRVS